MVKALDCRSDVDVRAGLIPVTGKFFFFNLMMMVERCAAAQSASVKASTKLKARGSEATENARGKQPSRRAGMSAANVGASKK